MGVVAALTLCVSIAAALYGAKELPGVVYPLPGRSVNPANIEALTADINRVQADIDRLQASLKSGANWVAENRTLPRLQKERADLVALRDAANIDAENRADTQHAEALADRADKVAKMQAYSIGAAIAAELVFLLCTAFVLYYLFRHFAEQHATEDTKEPSTSNPAGFAYYPNGTPTAPANNSPQNIARRPIGFFHDNGNRTTQNVEGSKRTCSHCGKAYVYGHARQKYCSDDCRVAAWEARTGRPLQKQKSNA